MDQRLSAAEEKPIQRQLGNEDEERKLCKQARTPPSAPWGWGLDTRHLDLTYIWGRFSFFVFFVKTHVVGLFLDTHLRHINLAAPLHSIQPFFAD
jgi:hypothetical protein